MGAAVAVLLIKERHIVEAMEALGVTSPAAARSIEQLGDLGIDPGGMAWRALKNRATVREAASGRYYVDIEVWEANRRRRKRILTLVLTVVLIAAAVTLLNANRLAP